MASALARLIDVQAGFAALFPLINERAKQTDVDIDLAFKADTAYVDAELELKQTTIAVNPLDYGAAGDGATNDAAALILAITAAAALGLVLDGGGRTYKINSPVFYTLPAGRRRLAVRNMVLDMTGLAGTAGARGFVDKVGLCLCGTDIWQDSYVSADVAATARWATAMTVDDSSKFAVGDYVLVHDQTADWDTTGASKKTDYTMISSIINSTRVGFATPLLGDYTTNGTLRKYQDQTIDIDNVHVIGSGDGALENGVFVFNVREARLNQVTTELTQRRSVIVANCYSVDIRGSGGSKGQVSGLGYGLQVAGCGFVQIDGVGSASNRHAFTAGAGIYGSQVCRNIQIGSVYALAGGDAGFDIHPGVDVVQVGLVDVVCDLSTTFLGDAFIWQGANLQVDQVRVHGFKRHGLFLQPSGNGGEGNATCRIGSLIARGDPTTGQYGFNFTDSNAAQPLATFQIDHVDSTTRLGCLVAMTSTGFVESMVLNGGRIEATSATAANGLRVTNGTNGQVRKVVANGVHFKAPAIALAYPFYAQGVTAKQIKALVWACTFEGGANPARINEGVLTTVAPEYTGGLAGTVTVGTGGSVVVVA